ncbi:MAG: CRISPR-associated helicase Cas3' [Chloroflexi bacterium]|nr:CRISPR-associated helicase Cas3' [Chloroflexota bacterium]
MTTPSLPTANYNVLWAKSAPRHPLWKHLLDAAAVSLALPSPLVNFGWKAEETALLVGLHDIGKADSRFQHQNFSDELVAAGFPVTGDAPCRHERISACFIRETLRKAGMSDRDADTVGRAVLAHHGYWNESPRRVPSPYKEAQEEILESLESSLGISRVPILAAGDHSAFGMRLTGHVVLADWIASNEKFFGDARLKDVDDPEAYLAAAREMARAWIDQLGLKRNQQAGEAARVVEAARPIQQTLLDRDIPPGLVIIEAPMGEGKTEAAWILAEKWRDSGYHGMYMALPTMATSDSLYKRYRDDYLDKLGRGEAAKLVHGMAWLRDEKKEPDKLEVGERGDDNSLAAAWFRPTRLAILASHGVGTVDQAMLAGMNVKFGFLRLYGLADRVLVIDEVHAYDAYMSAIIARLLQWCACLKIPVILLSATLSARQRSAMTEAYGGTGGDPGPDAPYPLITVAQAGKEAWTIKANASSSRMLKIQTHPALLGDAEKTAAKAAELVKDGGCCCVILNTVKQAQAVYSNLPQDMPKLLFHSRFTASDRQRITENVLDMFGKGRWDGEGQNRKFKPAERPPDKFVLVATQVVEQSLDVDFDHMISEIAPMDLLLQRSGRIKRHTRTKKGRLKDAGDDERGQPALHVLLPATEKKQKDGTTKTVEKPEFGASQKIYQAYPLLTTLRLLKPETGKHEIDVQLPLQFRPLIEATYADASDDLKEAKAAWDDLQEDLGAQAGEFLLCEPMADEFDPVGADEVGDDSDDGNSWRARTRLGMEDVLAIPIRDGSAEELAKGELGGDQVRDLYRQSVKFPAWLWPLRADAKLPEAERKNREPRLGKCKLRGVWLLPVNLAHEGWMWSGERRLVKDGAKEEWKPIAFEYGKDMGLQEAEDKPKAEGGEK